MDKLAIFILSTHNCKAFIKFPLSLANCNAMRFHQVRRTDQTFCFPLSATCHLTFLSERESSLRESIMRLPNISQPAACHASCVYKKSCEVALSEEVGDGV